MTTRSISASLLIVLSGLTAIGCGSSSGGGGGVAAAPTPPPFAISTTSLPPGTTGTSYSSTLAAGIGTQPYTWSLPSGSLPPGVTLTPDGQLTGTPTQTGTFSFRVRVVDTATASATQDLSISVFPPMTLSPQTIPDAITGQNYSTNFQAGGGNPPYTYGLAGAPGWLSIDVDTGTLSGLPPAAGQHTFSVFVDGVNSGRLSQSYTLTVQ